MSTKTKLPIGLLNLTFVPIDTEPDAAVPTYKAATYEKSLGHAVRANLTLETAQLRVYGDDALQVADDPFVSASLETETNMTDLELEQALFGGTYASGTGLESSAGDTSALGGVYFVRKLLKKDKSTVYRACVLYRCQANRSSYGFEANTKAGTIEPKNSTVTFDVFECNNGAWKWEQEYDSLSAATTAIGTKLHPTVQSGGTP